MTKKFGGKIMVNSLENRSLMLTPNEISLINQFDAPDNSTRFIEQNTAAKILVEHWSVKGGIAGGLIGASLGGGGGFLIGGPAGLGFGGVGGAILGGVVGHCLGKQFSLINIESSESYNQWRTNQLFADVYPILDKLTTGLLVNFQCPISHGLIQCPVVTKCGHVFERILLEKWIRTSPQPTCPSCRRPLTGKLLYAPDYHQKLLKTIADAIKNANYPYQCIRPVEELIGDTNAQRTQVLRQVMDIDFEKFQNNEISAKALAHSLKKNKDLFGQLPRLTR
jgi:Zinc-finger of the MIZ type in Nse subunit